MKEVVVEDISPTAATWGNRKRTRVGIYNSKQKHGFYPGDKRPVTRIEVRFRGSAIKTRWFGERWVEDLLRYSPFSRIRFRSLRSKTRITKPQERLKFDYFCLMVRHFKSFRIALQRLRSYDPAHSYRLEPLLRRFERKDYSLIEIFKKDLRRFISAEVSKTDRLMLKTTCKESDHEKEWE